MWNKGMSRSRHMPWRWGYFFVLRFPCLPARLMHMFLTTGNINWLDRRDEDLMCCFPFFVALKKSGNLLLNYKMCELLFGVNVKGGFFWKPLLYINNLVGGFYPSEKYWSEWKPSPNRGENKRSLKPPPSNALSACSIRIESIMLKTTKQIR